MSLVRMYMSDIFLNLSKVGAFLQTTIMFYKVEMQVNQEGVRQALPISLLLKNNWLLFNDFKILKCTDISFAFGF